MHELLQRIVDVKRAEVGQVAADGGPGPNRPIPAPRNFADALVCSGISAIAEFKRRSPSRGEIRPDADPTEIAVDYERHGARALSVLTDRKFFGGSLEDLAAARAATSLPVLRKDFILDPRQIHESKQWGADAVLLIVRILGPSLLCELMAAARELGLATLVEVHSEQELAQAMAAQPEIVGINNRDLDTLEIDGNRAIRMRQSIPRDCLAVAESGVRRRADVLAAELQGFHAVLVGEVLMTADAPGPMLGQLLGRGPS